MNELIITLIIIGVAASLGSIIAIGMKYGREIINFIKSFINWHKK